jgi:hypothetical protein
MNAGGRPRGVVQDVLERLDPYTLEFVAALASLRGRRMKGYGS